MAALFQFTTDVSRSALPHVSRYAAARTVPLTSRMHPRSNVLFPMATFDANVTPPSRVVHWLPT